MHAIPRNPPRHYPTQLDRIGLFAENNLHLTG